MKVDLNNTWQNEHDNCSIKNWGNLFEFRFNIKGHLHYYTNWRWTLNQDLIKYRGEEEDTWSNILAPTFAIISGNIKCI